MAMGFKVCNLECEFQHEGHCAILEYVDFPYGSKIPNCTAKTNDDLVCSECGKQRCECD